MRINFALEIGTGRETATESEPKTKCKNNQLILKKQKRVQESTFITYITYPELLQCTILIPFSPDPP